MGLPVKLADLAPRVTTGVFILNSGLGKRNVDPEHAARLHGMASGAYPFLKGVPPQRFLKLLSAGEIAVGSLLLAPFVPALVAGAALTAFSGGLLGLYLRTPGLHKPGSVWPTQNGTGVSKDVWMLGIGLGLLAESIEDARNS